MFGISPKSVKISTKMLGSSTKVFDFNRSVQYFDVELGGFQPKSFHFAQNFRDLDLFTSFSISTRNFNDFDVLGFDQFDGLFEISTEMLERF